MLITGFDAVLADLDGVVYAGSEAIPGATESLDRLAGVGVGLAYITNNASRSPTAVADHLRHLGAPATAETVFGSADAGTDMLAAARDPGDRVLVVGSAYLRDCVVRRGFRLAESAKDRPDAVIQGFDPAIGWKDLAEASYAIANGAAWFATNTDLTIPQAGGIAPGNGSLVNAVAAATGATPRVAGKPEPVMFRRAAEHLQANRPLVVGDRLDTDILGGNRAGYTTAAVLTGIDSTRSILAARAAERPDFILRNLTELFTAYPAIRATGRDFECGRSRAWIENDRLVVAGTEDDVDSWRAACAAWWYAHPNSETAREPDLDFRS